MKRRADGRFQKRIKLPNGKSKVLYSSAKTERKAVEDFNRQMLTLEQERKKGLLFGTIALEWKQAYREKHSDINFRKSVSSSFDKVYNFFCDYDITEIETADISAFLEHLKQQNFSLKTVASNKCVVNMIFKYAIGKRLVSVNPVRNAEMPEKLPRTKRILPTDKELSIVNNNFVGFDFLPYFLLNTGLRISEALPLCLDDFDFQNMTITINKHLIHDNNKPIIEPVTKTDASERQVILLDRVAEKLPRRKGLIFCNADGTPYTKKQLQCRWNAYRKKHGINITAHQLRHGYATMLFEAGIPEKDAQELMGHTDISLTRQIYTHIRAKRKLETARKLNNFSFGE